MHPIVNNIIIDFEAALLRLHQERLSDERGSLPQVTLKLIGQIGLLANKQACEKLLIPATRDVDALFKVDWIVRTTFKEVVARQGLVFDDLSEEAWIPSDATFNLISTSERLKVYALDPLDILVSKAKMAPEKNRILVAQGISLYKEKLLERFTKHEINPDQFIRKNP